MQKQLDAYETKNGSQNKYGYLRTQVNCLQAQIVKLNTLVGDLTDRKNQLHEQKESIRKNLQLCGNEISANGNITPDALPCTNSVARSHQTEYQNQHKRLFADVIRETSEASQSTEDINVDLPAKRLRYSNCQSDEHQKFLKREYIRQKRLSAEYRQKENLKQRECDAQRCSSTEFREKENLKQREHNAQKRSSTEFRQKENLKQRERHAQRRTSTDFRQKENLKQRDRDAQRHRSTELRQKENLKQRDRDTQRCSSTELRDNEKEREKHRKAQKCTSEKFRDKENAHKQARTLLHTYGNSLFDSIKIFSNAVSQGPVYVCSSCLQTNFADSVVEVSTLHPGKHQPLLAECLTQYKSINEAEWLCLSCKREIYEGLVPKLSQINKVGFPERPPELDLNRLEEFFVAPLSAFMTIRSPPVCGLVSAGQKLLIGNVVHVANNVGTTVSSLPRMLDDMDTVTVRIKRK